MYFLTCTCHLSKSLIATQWLPQWTVPTSWKVLVDRTAPEH